MHADPRPKPRLSRRGVLPWIVLILLVAMLILFAVYRNTQRSTVEQPPAAQAPAPIAPTPAPPAIRHPIETAPAATISEEPAACPALADSDALWFEALAGWLPDDGWRALLAGDFFIQRFVATVDNLPRRKLAAHLLPVKPAPGTFLVDGTADAAHIAAGNAARYDPYLRILQAVNERGLVSLYLRCYPLFQQAYRELGHPEGYFNDRLIEVIDHLLAASQPEPPVSLVRPKVFWEYADPVVEQASAGEKLLIRIGPQHADVVRAKLATIRALLTTQPPAAG